MEPTHHYLPTKHPTDVNRVGFHRVAVADLTKADKEYVAALGELAGAAVLTEIRYSPELKTLITTYLQKKEQENGQPA